MKKSKIKFIIRKCVVETYGKAGYTTTADSLLKLFNGKIDKLYKSKK